MKYDTGILGTATDIYDARDSNSKFERKTEYSSLTQIDTNSRANLYISGLNTSGTIELEIKSIQSTISTLNIGLNFYNGTSYCGFFGCHQMGMTASECEDWIKLKITYEGTSFTVVNVDNPVRTVTRTTSAEINSALLTIGINSSVSEVQIRNVKIY